jgi:hypothetical protein
MDQEETLDLIGELTDALRKAVDAIELLDRKVDHLHGLVLRHDQTIRVMHQGLHSTTEPS